MTIKPRAKAAVGLPETHYALRVLRSKPLAVAAPAEELAGVLPILG